MKHNHLQNGISSRKPLLHDTLEERLSNKLLLFGLELNSNSLKHFLNLSVLLGHDGLEQGGDRGGDELAECTLKVTILILCGPDLTGGIEIPVTPKLLHHLCLRDTKLGTVRLGELLEGEGPLVKTRTESNTSLGRVDLDISEGFVVVGGDNNVDGLDGTAESLVKLFSRELKFEKGAIDLVHHENRLHTL
jgi:hypothetical protein